MIDGFGKKRFKRLITAVFKCRSRGGKEVQSVECLPCAGHCAFHDKTSFTAFNLHQQGEKG